MRFHALAAATLASALAATATAQDVEADRAAVQAVVEAAYVKGVHQDRDVAAIRAGFHAGFRMLVRRAEGTMHAVTLDEWIAGIERAKAEAAAHPGQPPRPPARAEYPLVAVVGDAALVRLELYRGDTHVFTDFLQLYRLAEGWRIVGKSFFAHPRPATGN